MIDTKSDPGAWRAAFNPARSCAVCLQPICGHSDLEYAGLFPVSDGGRQRTDALASARSVSFHDAEVSHG